MVTFTTAAGMVSSNSFGGDGYISKTVVYESGVGPISTNEYSWQNNLLWKHLDPRGLLTTNSWDGLLRLTKVEYPDGSYMRHAYTNGSGQMLLGLTYTLDRLGNETRWTYTRRQAVEDTIDALGTTTRNGYCLCGALESTTRAYGTGLAEMTEYYHDWQSQLTAIDFPDGSWKTNAYNLLGQLTVQGDAFGSTTNYYDNLGRMVSSSNYFGQVLAMVYDAEGNVTSRTDPNGVTVTSTYDDLHRIRTRTYPDSGVEAFGYTANLPWSTSYTNQLSKVTTVAYDVLGRKTKEIFSGTISNRFTYSPAGDLLTLTDGKTNITTWNYNAYGQVAYKRYADNATNLTYLYDANGRLTNRWSPAKGHTYYNYDAVGNLTNINYPTSADVAIRLDALHRVTNEVVSGVFTNDYTYHAGGALATEDGPFPSDTVTYTYSGGLRSGLSVQQPVSSFTNGYSYDAAKRLTTLTSTSGTYTYDYWPTNGGVTAPTDLIRKLTLPNTSYITNLYDNNGRWTRTTLKNSSNTELNDHDYIYNVGNQRTKHTRTDDSHNNYTYDDFGRLYTVRTTNSIGTELTTEKFGYNIDNGHNIAAVTNNATITSYVINNLNQNTSNYSYDSNGNPTSGSPAPWTYSFDDENRLASATVSTTSKSEFFYDARSRLRKRIEYGWQSGAWVVAGEIRYVYEGMLPLQHRNASDVPTETYTRGTDLSGTYAGVGGIGGMRARTTGYNTGTGAWTTHMFYHADANGNNTYMVQSAQTLAAKYTYDPYGNIVSSSGIFATSNPYRFSSKERHNATGLFYFGYRFYDSVNGRWINRDPVGERDGPNLYSFVSNEPITFIDPLGLSAFGSFCRIACEVGSRPPVGRLTPPEGSIPNPFRPGSYGRIDPQTGKFEECWRFDAGRPGAPGHQGRNHYHYWPNRPGGGEHLYPPLPPFTWFTAPPLIPPINSPPPRVVAPPGYQPPPNFVPIIPVLPADA